MLLLALLVTLGLGGCDAGGGADEGPMPDADVDSGAIPYMNPCDLAADSCEEELLCFGFNMRGPHCTHACTTDADCAPPSRGCNNMGVCKAP